MIIKAYTNASEPALASLVGATAPKGMVSYSYLMEHAAALVSGGATPKEAADFIASKFAVFLAIMESPDAGDRLIHTVVAGAGSTGHDTEYVIDGGAHGTVTVGWSHEALPAQASKAEILAMIPTIAEERLTEQRVSALRRFHSDRALKDAAASRTPLTGAEIEAAVAVGLDWYADESVSADDDEILTALAAAGLITEKPA